ncbi:MAG: hypothetical protein HRT77_03200 [Halioglobus sp.]|nr:hypothetical protein [Halioglobus sp.]
MKTLSLIIAHCYLVLLSSSAQAYTYLSCPGGSQVDFNGGHMTFNYADNLSEAQKAALSRGHQRLTAFSDSSITTIDNADTSYYSGNGENEIYLDSNVPTASCTYWVDPGSCTVVEADMQYGNQDWVTTDDSQHFPYAGGRSMTGTAIHEGGHCIGMAHTNNLYNMMGADYSHVTRQGIAAYYGPGEDLSDGLIDLHGERSGGVDTYRDVGATILRYGGFSGEYSLHVYGRVKDFSGVVLPGVGAYLGQPTYRVAAGAVVQMELTLENNGEADVETPNLGVYLSDNDIISASDKLLLELPVPLSRDAPLEFVLSVVIPAETSDGNYFLGAYVDHDDQIGETTVANNAAYYPLSVLGLAPAVVTGNATDITRIAATLNGTINPNGLETTAYFDFGVTVNFGSTVAVGSVGASTSNVNAAVAASDLLCDTVYYYRARGESSNGTSLGDITTFTTAACSAGCY